MKVLLVHNHYQQSGGEDSCFEAEGQLLEQAGHQVVRFTRHNDEVRQLSRWATARLTLWNSATYRDVRSLIQRERPDVLHCTNTFPLISPAVYYAAHSEGVAVVQALHNYRLLCPNALLLRDQTVCEDCLGKLLPLPSIRYGCYRGSRAASAVVAAMLFFHRLRGTYNRAVDRYYALTEFSRSRFIAGGLPAEKLMVKPNFVPDVNEMGAGAGDYCVFVGRLSVEKGVATLLEAWRQPPAGLRLKIVGDGPLRDDVVRAVASQPQIEWLGHRPVEELPRIIGQSRCLILPSICYENFPRAIVEAYAVGTPVIASRLGAMAELVDHGRLGLLFDANDARSLAAQVELIAANPLSRTKWRQAVRDEYLARYTPQRNLERLLEIYDEAIDARARTRKFQSTAGPAREFPLTSLDKTVRMAHAAEASVSAVHLTPNPLPDHLPNR